MPALTFPAATTWMAGSSPAMTRKGMTIGAEGEAGG